MRWGKNSCPTGAELVYTGEKGRYIGAAVQLYRCGNIERALTSSESPLKRERERGGGGNGWDGEVRGGVGCGGS